MKLVIYLCLTSALASLSGCASFQVNLVKPVKSFPEPSIKRDVCVNIASIKVQPEGNWLYSTDLEAVKRGEERACIKRMNKSRLFGSVSTEPNQDGITVRIWKIKGCTEDYAADSLESEAMLLAYILTFFTIPLS